MRQGNQHSPGARRPQLKKGAHLDKLQQLLGLAPAEHGEHVRRLLHRPRDRDTPKRRAAPDLLRDARERRAHALLCGTLRGAVPERGRPACRDLGLSLVLARAEHAPGDDAHALCAAHRDDLALQVASRKRPLALVCGDNQPYGEGWTVKNAYRRRIVRGRERARSRWLW